MTAHKGIPLSLVSSVLFAVFCYYSVFLHPLNGWQIAGWRAVTTVLLLMLAFRKKRGPFWHDLMSVIKSTRLLIATFACAALLGLQILIFCWAPVNGQSRSLALGKRKGMESSGIRLAAQAIVLTFPGSRGRCFRLPERVACQGWRT